MLWNEAHISMLTLFLPTFAFSVEHVLILPLLPIKDNASATDSNSEQPHLDSPVEYKIQQRVHWQGPCLGQNLLWWPPWRWPSQHFPHCSWSISKIKTLCFQHMQEMNTIHASTRNPLSHFLYNAIGRTCPLGTNTCSFSMCQGKGHEQGPQKRFVAKW